MRSSERSSSGSRPSRCATRQRSMTSSASASTGSSWDPHGSHEDPVEAEADEVIERWRVAHLLGRLPDEERSLLRMRFYDDLSQTEISAATGIALGTVKARM